MAETNIPVTSGSGNAVDVFSLPNSNLRQSVVVGDSAIAGNVAPVQATDPSSNAFGVVVRDVNTSAVVARLGQTMFVQFDPGHTLGTVIANAGTGTFTVQFDPGHELGTIKGNSNTLTVFLPDTGHEIGTIRGNTNTLTVFLPDTGHTIGKVDAGAGTFTVKFDPGYELGSVKGINSSVNVLLKPGTIAVSLDPGYTLGSVQSINSTVTVKFDPGYELGSIKGINTTVNVLLKPGTIAVSLDPGYTLGNIQGINTTVTVKFDPGYTLGKVDQGNATTSGTQAWLTNIQGTASLFTVSGSTSGISVSGVTLISPSANASFKVYAYSIQTTGQVSLTCKFTNGAGSGPTEFWRPLITASGVTGAQGANLMSAPGQPLFVTGVSTTLALLLDSASLVHYSVSYTKESA